MRGHPFGAMSWFAAFLCVVVMASGVAVVALWVRVEQVNDQLVSKIALVEERVDQGERMDGESGDEGEAYHTVEFIDYYRDINVKMDQAIDRLIAIVEATVTTMLVFGFLLAYKAPRDVERELQRLQSETESAKESAEEARYQAMICIAEGKETTHDKMAKYDSIIERYPGRPDAYNARGSTFDKMREYDRAIKDYEMAYEHGGEEGTYLNNVAVAHAKAGHHELAESFYTRAIDGAPNDAMLYGNRAIARSEQGNFDGAMSDFEIAISLDPRDHWVYINRALTYRDMYSGEGDPDARRGYVRHAVEDLITARELEPSDKRAYNLLNEVVEDLRVMSPAERDVKRVFKDLAQTEGRLASDALAKRDGLGEALEHFNRALEMNVVSHFEDGAKVTASEVQSWLASENLAMPAISAVKNREAMTDEKELKLGSLLSNALMNAAMDAYGQGDTLAAERLFSALARSENVNSNYALTNLAYMRRRGETAETPDEAIDMLDSCTASRAGVWTMNVALCYADGVGVETDDGRFLELLRGDSVGARESFEWWSQEEIVGARESNLALLGLALAGFTSLGDTVPVDERLSRAREDGYEFRGVEV